MPKQVMVESEGRVAAPLHAARRSTPPDLKPRLTIHLTELAHDSQVTIEPGPDDWFGPTDISRFIQRVQIDAKVGDATKAQLDCILVNVTADRAVLEALTQRELVLTRFARLWRWWLRHGFRFRTRVVRTTTFQQKAHTYTGATMNKRQAEQLRKKFREEYGLNRRRWWQPWTRRNA